MQSTKKKLFFATALTAVACAVGLAYSQAHAEKPVKTPVVTAVTVGTQVAKVTQVPQTLLLSGLVVPKDAFRVGTELAAIKVAEVTADVGARVAKGQVLARLSTAQLDNALRSAEAELERAQAAARAAEQQVESARAQANEAQEQTTRAERVQETGALSKEAIGQRQTSAKTAAAALRAAEAQHQVAVANIKAAVAALTDTQTKLSFSSIVSPVNGVVSQRNIAVGEVVGAASNPLFVVNSDVQDIEVELSSQQREMMSKLTQAKLDGQDKALTLRWVSPGIYTSGYTAKARLTPTGKDTLVAGTRTKVRLTFGTEPAMVFPMRALLKGEKGWQVYVADKGKAVARQVEVQEPLLGDTATVRSGISAGDHVLVDGVDFVQEGMAVTEVVQESK